MVEKRANAPECVRNRSRSETQCKASRVAGFGGERAKSARRRPVTRFCRQGFRVSPFWGIAFCTALDYPSSRSSWPRPGSLPHFLLETRHNGDPSYAQSSVNVPISPIPSLELTCATICSADIATRHSPSSRRKRHRLNQPVWPESGYLFFKGQMRVIKSPWRKFCSRHTVALGDAGENI